MKRYQATFTVVVDLTVNNDNVIDRVLNNEDGWRDYLYDLDEEGVVEMLARCCGIQGARLSDLDGWADLPDGDVSANTIIELDEYRRIA